MDKRENDGWISVEDRLPEDDETVWVHYDNEQNYGYCWNKRWFLNQDGRIKIKVTHWQPLPEPPEQHR